MRTSGDTILYYPFHTPRGIYSGSTLTAVLDSTGGSWLGGKIKQFNDGTFLFDNMWGDSIIIKTRANVGDTWIFCRDSTNLYYQAQIIGLDTMTVLGALDSVKTILISARDSSSTLTTDPVDSFQIVLSKNNGFVQVFDLYTFPYHAPGSSYIAGAGGFDYFLDKTVQHSPYPIPNSSPSTFNFPDVYNSVFRLTSFTSPSFSQLFQWHNGDVYEYSICNGSPSSWGCSCNTPYTYEMDTVTSFTSTTTSIVYSVSGWVANLDISGGSLEYTKLPATGTLTYDTAKLIDPNLMPEEFHQTMLYYYWPIDTSLCINNALYATVASDIRDTLYAKPWEWTDPVAVYKSPLGLLHSFDCYSGSSDFDVDEKILIYYNKGGVSCNTASLPTFTSVDNVHKINEDFTLSPNPATISLTIVASEKISSIAILNLLGQTVYTNEYNAQKTIVDISTLPTGVYFLKVNNTKVQKFAKE